MNSSNVFDHLQEEATALLQLNYDLPNPQRAQMMSFHFHNYAEADEMVNFLISDFNAFFFFHFPTQVEAHDGQCI